MTIPTDLDLYKNYLNTFLAVMNVGVSIFSELPEGSYPRRQIATLLGTIETIEKKIDPEDVLGHKAAVIATRQIIERARTAMNRAEGLPDNMRKAKIRWMKAAKTAVQNSKEVRK